jgi:hypothetical protein
MLAAILVVGAVLVLLVKPERIASKR